MTRVLMTADAIGGVWQYSLELARGLEPHGLEVLLAVMGGGLTPSKRDEVAALGSVRLFENAGKLEWMDSPSEDVASTGRWLLQVADAFSPDVVHLNGYSHAALPWNAPVVVVAHSCVLSWFRNVLGQDAPDSWNTYATSVRRGLQAADVVVAPTRAMLDDLVSLYGHLPRTRIIFNARDASMFRPVPKQNLILAAGRLWDEAKNFRTLDKAAQNVAWPILAAGSGQHPNGGVHTFASLRELGHLTNIELSEWYARAAIYALPSLYEPFGLTALEAALSGCALLLSDIPSLREIWGDAACYASPHDPAEWREQLNVLANHASRRYSFATAAFERAQKFTVPRMTLDYLEAYEQARIHRQCASHSSVIPSGPTGITETLTSYAA